MKNCRRIWGALAPLLLCPPWISPAQASPKLGDKAPPIAVSTWLTNQPPALPNAEEPPDHAFLIAFWTPGIPQCEENIPFLNRLQTERRKDGLIIIAISDETPDAIQKFINDAHERNIDVNYAVASDDDLKTSTAWTDDIETIPHAFVVDRAGLVVWSGATASTESHAQLETVIGKVLAGNYDLATAKRAAKINRLQTHLEHDLQAAYFAGDQTKVFEAVDMMIAIRPNALRPYLLKRYFLRQFKRDAETPAVEKTLEETFKDSIEDLRSIVRLELEAPLHQRSPGLLLRCATRINKLGRGRNLNDLAALAQIQCELGQVAQAIATQRNALKLAPDALRERHKQTLDYYIAVQKLASKSQKEEAPSPKDKDASATEQP